MRRSALLTFSAILLAVGLAPPAADHPGNSDPGVPAASAAVVRDVAPSLRKDKE